MAPACSADRFGLRGCLIDGTQPEALEQRTQRTPGPGRLPGLGPVLLQAVRAESPSGECGREEPWPAGS